MPHYRAPNNTLHFLDDVSFENLLPSGSIQVTAQEEEAIERQQQKDMNEFAAAAARAQQVQPVTGAVA